MNMRRSDMATDAVHAAENEATSRFDAGDVVIDRDDESPNEAVVVNTPPIEAADWHVPGRGTLAEDNPAYPEDDAVVIVLFRDALERHYPHYTGGGVIRMRRLQRDGAKPYAFPSSRLQRIGTLSPEPIPLDRIDPSPYHARNFDSTANTAYIEAVRDRGRPETPPHLRDCGDRFEIINGHKRIWASHVAGLEAVPCHCIYVDDETAARKWIWSHLDSYDERERTVARRRLRAAFGPRAECLESAVMERKERMRDD